MAVDSAPLGPPLSEQSGQHVLVANEWSLFDLSRNFFLLKSVYHLRRLRLHGLIERARGTHRYRVTDSGWRTALFCTRVYSRVLRPGLAQIIPEEAQEDSVLRRQFDRLDQAINRWVEEQKVPA